MGDHAGPEVPLDDTEENAMKTLKRLVLVGLVGAAVAAVAKRLQAGGEQQWQSAEPRP